MSFYERPLEPIYSKQKSFYNATRIRFFDGGYRVLASYTTEVCCCNPQTGYVELLCLEEDLTSTTTRHLREFLAQSGFKGLAKKSKAKIVEYLKECTAFERI